MKHIIICSHGFGVKRDDRGFFPDAVSLVPGAEIIMFDYNAIEEGGRVVRASPFTEQVIKLREVLEEAREKNPDAVIDIVSHSQGAIAIGLLSAVDVKGVKKIIMAAPPYTLSGTRIINRFKNNPETKIDFTGTSALGRGDGTISLVGERFWQELEMLRPVELYNYLAGSAQITHINANQDEVFGVSETSLLSKKIKILNIDSDHMFTGKYRQNLKELIRDLLSYS